jgi:hypothetical protein
VSAGPNLLAGPGLTLEPEQRCDRRGFLRVVGEPLELAERQE